jgi:Rrf2 family protein
MFSKSGQYAIRAILFLALNDEANKLKVDDIAEELDISKHYLAKILQQLTKSGIISSAKGRNGGFYISKEKRSLNMLTAVQAIEGPVKLNDCILGLKECSDAKPCPYHFSVSKYRNKFYKELKNETIESCAKRVDITKLKNRPE